jgi:hypothetical protein
MNRRIALSRGLISQSIYGLEFPFTGQRDQAGVKDRGAIGSDHLDGAMSDESDEQQQSEQESAAVGQSPSATREIKQSAPAKSLRTFKYVPHEDASNRIGWRPPRYSGYGAMLQPAQLVPADDPSAKHVLIAHELFDVVEDSELHHFVRVSHEFTPASRAELAAADGKPVAEPRTVPRYDDNDVNPWRDPVQDEVWKHATSDGQRPDPSTLTIPGRRLRSRDGGFW